MSNATRGVGDSGDSSSYASFHSSLPGERVTAGSPIREPLPPTYRVREVPDAEPYDAAATPSVQMVRVHAIETGEDGPAAAVPALVESIRTYGLLEPLLVQKRDRRYRLIAGAKRLAAALAAGLQEVPCVVHPIGDEAAHAVATALKAAAPAAAAPPPSAAAPADLRGPNLSMLDEAIASSLSAVISSTTLLSESGPRLARNVAIDMIRAEARRALCLLHSARELRYGLPSEQRVVSPAAVVQHVVDMLLPEAQLRGIVVDSAVGVAEGSQIRVNEELLAHALFGAALMITAPLNAFHGPRVKVAAAGDAAGRVTLSVMQQSVAVPRTWPSAPDGPEAYALVPILALRHIAEASGGRLTTTRLSDGTRVSLELPLLPRQS